MAAILAALALSPLSLYHYRAEAWWGPRPRAASELRGAPTIDDSRLDPSYAEVDDCAASGGAFLLHHGRVVGLEVDGFGCASAPPGIIRSLHGRCLLAR